MTQTYRTDDLLRWGTGKGSNLTPTEVDRNFWDIIARLVTQESRPDPSAGIDFFTSTGSTFFVHMTDLTVQGPYALPQFDFIDRGDWAPSQTYSVNDVFTENGGLYRVLFAHTSDLIFDAGANDGMGHDFYRLWFQAPGSALPTGGVVGQVVTKSSTAEFANNYTWKFPSGGTARQYLIQQSSTQDDAAWETPQADDIEFTPVTGSALISNNVADALEELSVGEASTDAVNVTYTPPTGSSLSSTNVQDAIDELDAAELSNTSVGNYYTVPAGNVSTTEKAMGLGATFTFTSDKSGVVLVWIAGMVLNSTAAGDGVTITGRHGTGTAPSNGDTSSLGTQFSTPQHFVASTTAGQQGFMVMGKITGLTPGVAHWFDISIVAVTAGGATVKDVQFIAVEAS